MKPRWNLSALFTGGTSASATVTLKISPVAANVISYGASALTFTAGIAARTLTPQTGATLTGWSVLTGNAGGWLNTSGTGRYTPPAGRYRVEAGYTSGLSSAPTFLGIKLRKNGTDIPGTVNTASTALAGYYAEPTASCVIDMNGTDWIDVQAQSTTAASNVAGPLWFSAIPVQPSTLASGVTGLLWRSIGIQNVAGLTNVDFTNLPTDVNHVKAFFSILPTNNDAQLVVQLFDNVGALVNTFGWTSTVATNTQTGSTAPSVMNNGATGVATYVPMTWAAAAANNGIYNGAAEGCAGHCEVYDIRNSTRRKHITSVSSYVQATASAVYECIGGGRDARATPTAITGLRFLLAGAGAGTFASGTIELWGSP